MLADHGLAVAELDPAWWWTPGAASFSIPPELDPIDVFRFDERELFRIGELVGARSLNAADVLGGNWGVEEAAAAFAALCDRAADHGLLVHLEWLAWSRIPDLATAWDVVRLADRPNGGLNVDTWHCARAGTTAEDLRAVPGERVLAVQLDDGPAEAEDDLVEATLHRRLLPGDGRVRPRRLPRRPPRRRRRRTDRRGGVLRRPARPRSQAGGPTRRRGDAHRAPRPARPRRAPDDAVTGAAVVGTGFGCYTHVRALRAAGFDVLALVGRDPAKTAERAALFEVPRALTSLDEALAVAGVDAVTIATPPHTHAPLARQAIAAGRHVLCEKPFAADTEEAKVVLDAAESAGVVHVLGTEFRWDPGQAGLARAVRGRPGRGAASGHLAHARPRPGRSRTPPCPNGGRTPASRRRLVVGARLPADRPDPGHPRRVRRGERLPGPRRRPACDERGRRLRRALPHAQRCRGGDAVDGRRPGRPRRDPGDRVDRARRGSRVWASTVKVAGRLGGSHPAGARRTCGWTRRRRCPKGAVTTAYETDDHLRGGVRALRAPGRGVS